jgi:hypothetical protein
MNEIKLCYVKRIMIGLLKAAVEYLPRHKMWNV